MAFINIYNVCILSLTLLITVSVSLADDKPADDISVEILKPAPEDCQRKSKRLDMVSMHYVGTLTDTGKQFDSSLDRNQPFEFQLGTGQVIKGWDEGLLDMCVGEKRKLIIPASKGYGDQGAGELIPPKASLTFEVELISLKDGQAPPNVFKEIDVDGDKFLSQEEVSDYLKKQASKAGDKVQENAEQHKEIITQIFNHEDKDKDGLISHEEFSGPKHDEL
ncbi:uncharacterized protein LOC106070685 [Biomphalaria glabrata]|uniref:peptidylprolyl isomerase n=1 Tax=Biomphalaria glabrata TaxID=6526 RepID=A0A2C9K920_BIOGL|nr:uncharacterized protein LOC106070685 [Biomphalaria glabrata]KAI8761216.1 FK506-binding protein 2 [Biomphalaria glabrata]